MLHLYPAWWATIEIVLVPHKLGYGKWKWLIELFTVLGFTCCYQVNYWSYHRITKEWPYGDPLPSFMITLFVFGQPVFYLFYRWVICMLVRDNINKKLAEKFPALCGWLHYFCTNEKDSNSPSMDNEESSNLLAEEKIASRHSKQIKHLLFMILPVCIEVTALLFAVAIWNVVYIAQNHG